MSTRKSKGKYVHTHFKGVKFNHFFRNCEKALNSIFVLLNHFQRAISYICNTNGDIICQNGWMEPVDTDNRDPLSPCSEPICTNGCEHGTCVSPDW